jgi:hypothetical protein
VPRVRATASGTLGELAEVVAGFRDEYYGLVDLVREHEPGGDGVARLVTSGLVDWLGCSWGCRPARFAKQTWHAPALDLGEVERVGAPAVRRWVARAQAPKLVVANQTRVAELAVDTAGIWVPSVPALSVVPRDPADLWRLAAAVASPAATAWLLRRAPGTALARDALKVAAPDLLALPLPADDAAWEQAADAARTYSARPSAAARDRFALAAATAYGTPDSLTAWWSSRPSRPRTAASG